MSPNFETYKQKAIEACTQVFVNEYNRSIGIPIPHIDFILPDSANYKSGQYYIHIGETWQIHLNFGAMPISYKEFQEEVRVLTRHEVEHYMCCPFDILTHLRMINAIIETYNAQYATHKIDIVSLAASLANQTADIIIDTKNYFLHKEETLKSEISWIKKSGVKVFRELPRHSKLMFLVKAAIWNENLELDETDEELIEEINLLAKKIESGGITNKSLFIQKTIEYTHSFFKLFQQDTADFNSESSKKNDSGAQQKEQDSKSQDIPSKDSQENGSQFVFQSPDKIQEALAQLAQEISLTQFNEVLTAAGFLSLSDKEKYKLWFNAQNADIIPIIEDTQTGSNDSYSYPTSWKLGDPIEEIDMMLSFAMSPVVIPGVTTKKWVQNSIFNFGSKDKQADLLLVIDTSGSMGTLADPLSNMHQAILAAYGILKYFENKSTKVALVGFSEGISVSIDWTTNFDALREALLLNGKGGTSFPLQKIQNLIESRNDFVVTVLITDGELKNIGSTLEYFKEYLLDGNKLFIFLQDHKNVINHFKALSNYGAKVAKALTAAEMRDIVLSDLL